MVLHHRPRHPLGVLQYTELWCWATPRSAFRAAWITRNLIIFHTNTQVCDYSSIIYLIHLWLQTSQLSLQLRTVTQEMAARTVESCPRPSAGRSASSGPLRILINIQRHHRHSPLRKEKAAVKQIKMKSVEPLNIQRNLCPQVLFTLLTVVS